MRKMNGKPRDIPKVKGKGTAAYFGKVTGTPSKPRAPKLRSSGRLRIKE